MLWEMLMGILQDLSQAAAIEWILGPVSSSLSASLFLSPFYISICLHFCGNPSAFVWIRVSASAGAVRIRGSQSIGIRRGGSGQESQNNKFIVLSFLPENELSAEILGEIYKFYRPIIGPIGAKDVLQLSMRSDLAFLQGGPTPTSCFTTVTQSLFWTR